jgi:tetratricopeptide (TPR) repeat protein
MSGDLLRARAAIDAARDLADDDVTRWHDAFVLEQEGRAAEALAALVRCRTAFAGTGWDEGAAVLLSAFAHLGLGDPAAGRRAAEEAIDLIASLGDAWGLIHAEGALGVLAEATGRFADAARHHAQAAASAESLGFGGSAALHTANLGRAQHASGDPAAAASLRRAITGAERAGDLRLLAGTRVTLAEVLHSRGDRDGARELAVAASRWFDASGAGEDAERARALLTTLT